jgi:cobalt-zinc-cadmium resistance protein CzcA
MWKSDSPATINREWGRRLIRVQANVRDRDVASFVAEAQQRIGEKVKLPEGYVIEWGGQFENLQRAQVRFAIIVPLTMLLVFFLLYVSMKSLRDVLIIYTGIPFSVIGGVLALHYRGIPFSVSAAVGFIALIGIAVLNGQIMIEAMRAYRQEGMSLLRCDSARRERTAAPRACDRSDRHRRLHTDGAFQRCGRGSPTPLATVVVGGHDYLGTLLTLFLLPTLYLIVPKAPETGMTPKPE